MGETESYTRVSMHEDVTLYISKYTDRSSGRYFTDVNFYGPHHLKRADVYALLTGGQIQPNRSKPTSTVVRVPQH